VLGQHRSTQRKVPRGADDEEALTDDIVALARQYGRYGYRRVTALLRDAGWTVNRKRVERIWRREGLKVPQKQPKRGRLWLNDGSCIRLRPEYPGHVWAYDFVEGRTHDGRKLRILTIIDEASRECLALIVARQLKHEDVLAALAELFIARGPPANIRICRVPSSGALTRVPIWGCCPRRTLQRPEYRYDRTPDAASRHGADPYQRSASGAAGQPSLNKALVLELTRGEWIEQRRNVIALGPCLGGAGSAYSRGASRQRKPLRITHGNASCAAIETTYHPGSKRFNGSLWKGLIRSAKASCSLFRSAWRSPAQRMRLSTAPIVDEAQLKFVDRYVKKRRTYTVDQMLIGFV